MCSSDLAYGWSDYGALYRRVYDASDRTTVWAVCSRAAAEQVCDIDDPEVWHHLPERVWSRTEEPSGEVC